MNTLKEKIINHKIIVIIICLCIIAGCVTGLYLTFKDDEGYTTKVSNGDKTALKAADIEITKNDIYEYFLDSYGSNQVLVAALNYVADQEITDQDAINAMLEEKKATYASYANNDLDAYAKSIGYKDEAEFIDQYLTAEAKQELLKEKYIDEKYDSLIKTYKVRYIKVITVDTESQALKIIKGSTDDNAFQSYLSELNGQDEGLVTKESSYIDSNIIKKLDKFTKDGIYSKVIKTSDSKYAVVWVYNSDTKAVKDEIKEELANLQDISTKYETYYLSQYNFDVYESKIKDKIKEESEDYFG